jgi:hypothetical protein
MLKKYILFLSTIALLLGANQSIQKIPTPNQSDFFKKTNSPVITSFKWGEIIISQDGKSNTYKDAKVWTSKSKEWKWAESKTRHSPGIQIPALDEFIDDVDIVILSRGVLLELQIPQETIDYVKSKNKECITGQTEDMVKTYNELVKKNKKVGSLFHSTC